MHKYFIAIYLICASFGWSADHYGVLTEYQLANGMKVALKPVKDDSGELHIALSALGGYTVLAPEEQAAGQLAATVVWESGLGTLSGDQLAVLLYDNSLEYSLELDPFWRGMEGVSTLENLPMFLKITNLFFTRPNFNEDIFKRALIQAKETAAKRYSEADRAFEETAMAMNSQNCPGLRYLQPADLQNVKFETVKSFFKEAFSNPADFILVISGSFKIEDVQPMIEGYLGSIPTKGPSTPWKKPALNPFPSSVTKKTILTRRTGSLTQLSFPLMIPVTAETVHQIETLSTIIDARLRKVILHKYHTLRCVVATYEYPYYPYLDHPWFTIQFHGDFKQIRDIQTLIFQELNNLRTEGCTREELDSANETLAQAYASFENNGDYWTTILSNNRLWGWSLSSRDTFKGINLDKLPLTKEFSALFPLDQYTELSTQNGNR